MNSTIYTKVFDAPPVKCREILRYAGANTDLPETKNLLDSCLEELSDKLTYKVCYAHFPLFLCSECVDLSFAKVNSSALKKILKDCSSFVLFAATVGLELDRLISRYGRISPSRALMMQAIGAERIESLCDEFCKSIDAQVSGIGKCITPRFSPGYGDLPIEIQQDFFRVLEPYRKIGLSLNDSFLMSPSKSVTAIIGICSNEQSNKFTTTCSLCNKTDCTFRR